MSDIERRRELDEDLDRIVRTSGRVSFGAAAVSFVGAGLIWGIGKAAGGAASVFDYGAALIIGAVVSPALLLMAWQHRRASTSWAQQEQQRRRPEPEPPRRRATQARDRPHTGRHATLSPRRIRDTEDR